jgi:hypothetical protein
MRKAALTTQPSTFIDYEPLQDYITLVQCDSAGGDEDEIFITIPCLRTFIKELTKVADLMGA